MTLSPLHYWQRLESVRAAIGVGDHDDAAQILRTLKRELGGAAGPADAGRLVFIEKFAATYGLSLAGALSAPEHVPPAIPARASARPRLYIDAQHGLGNRLRAIASAAVVAAATGRELVIVWQPDAHCGCRWSDLFVADTAVIETAFLQAAAQAGCRIFNYMEIEPGACKDAPILADGGGDIYIRSAYPLVSPYHAWPKERQFLQSLVPVPEVADLVASVRHPNQVAAHVRMASGPGYEHLAHESPANWPPEAHAQIALWRGRSHARYFIARIDALIAAGQAETLFLAADLPETYDLFARHYGQRLAVLPRRVFDRSARQVQYALADTLLLGRAERFLGSTWSSMSDLARRLSPDIRLAEMSGRDF